MNEVETKTPQESRAYWLTDTIFVDSSKRCWVAITDEDKEVRQVCIGTEGTVKPALIKAGLIEGPKKRGRKPKKAKLKKIIISTPGQTKSPMKIERFQIRNSLQAIESYYLQGIS